MIWFGFKLNANVFSLDRGPSENVLCTSMNCVNFMSISKRFVLAQQGQSENDLCISIDCVTSMFDDIYVSRCYILARQRQSENDLCISVICVDSMLDDIAVSRCCILDRQGQSETDLRVSHMFFMFDEQVDDEVLTNTMITPT